MNQLKKRKGIILAGGTGSRLYPITKGICKQLLPIYDKPMIYYPLSTLMLMGIQEILIITRPEDLNIFKALLNDGKQWGININYKVQEKALGIAHSIIIAEEFIGESQIVLILGDNIFYGNNLVNQLIKANESKFSTIFGYSVKDPERYGVIEFNKDKEVLNIEEKPKKAKSKYVVTGIYFYDNSVSKKAKTLSPSIRGELEITDLNTLFLKENKLNVEILGRGIAWFDTGTFESLHESSSYIRTIENRQGLKIGCPEEIAWRNKWIDDNAFLLQAKYLLKSGYGEYLITLFEQEQ